MDPSKSRLVTLLGLVFSSLALLIIIAIVIYTFVLNLSGITLNSDFASWQTSCTSLDPAGYWYRRLDKLHRTQLLASTILALLGLLCLVVSVVLFAVSFLRQRSLQDASKQQIIRTAVCKFKPAIFLFTGLASIAVGCHFGYHLSYYMGFTYNGCLSSYGACFFVTAILSGVCLLLILVSLILVFVLPQADSDEHNKGNSGKYLVKEQRQTLNQDSMNDPLHVQEGEVYKERHEGIKKSIPAINNTGHKKMAVVLNNQLLDEYSVSYATNKQSSEAVLPNQDYNAKVQQEFRMPTDMQEPARLRESKPRLNILDYSVKNMNDGPGRHDSPTFRDYLRKDLDVDRPFQNHRTESPFKSPVRALDLDEERSGEEIRNSRKRKIFDRAIDNQYREQLKSRYSRY